jgi:hypothetical protein
MVISLGMSSRNDNMSPCWIPKELKKNKAPQRDKDSSPVPKLVLFVQIFSVHDGTDKLILSTIIRQ